VVNLHHSKHSQERFQDTSLQENDSKKRVLLRSTETSHLQTPKKQVSKSDDALLPLLWNHEKLSLRMSTHGAQIGVSVLSSNSQKSDSTTDRLHLHAAAPHLAQPDATVSHEAAVLKPFLVVYFAII
jgi:hypothetical protein